MNSKILKEFETEVVNKIKEREILIDIYTNEDKKVFLTNFGFKYMPIKDSFNKEFGKNVIAIDLHLIPLSDEFAQIVFCENVISKSEHPLNVLREFRRLLKGGGLLFMTLPHYCKEQIFNGEKDNKFIFSEEQIGRLLYFAGLIPIKVYTLKEGEEKDWIIITISKVM